MDLSTKRRKTMTYTIRYNAKTDHIEGIAERTKGSDLNYALSACPSLTRNGARMGYGESSEDLKELLNSSFGKLRKGCRNCLVAAETLLVAEAQANPEPKQEPVELDYTPCRKDIKCPVCTGS
jgi:hypothetical protein